MPGDTPFDITVAGKRLRQKVMLALALSSALPLLILVFVLHEYVLPGLDPADTSRFLGIQALIFFTIVGMLIGSFIIWGMGRTVSAIAELMSKGPNFARFERRTD